MQFEVFTTNVDLQDIPSYTTSITLEGQLLKLSFLWNERIGKRILSVRNSSDVCYLQNTILHPNESFELNSNAVFDDLPYKVVLQKSGDVKKVGNIYNWSKDFILCFYRTVDVEVEKLNVRYGVTSPSTPIILTPPTPENPLISCEGAINSVGISIGYYPESEIPVILATKLRLKFNDDEHFIDLDGVDGRPPYLSDEYGQIDALVADYLGYVDGDYDLAPFGGEISFRNNLNQNTPLRFEYELLPKEQTQFRVQFFGDNPTIENVSPTYSRVCLSQLVEN